MDTIIELLSFSSSSTFVNDTEIIQNNTVLKGIALPTKYAQSLLEVKCWGNAYKLQERASN